MQNLLFLLDRMKDSDTLEAQTPLPESHMLRQIALISLFLASLFLTSSIQASEATELDAQALVDAAAKSVNTFSIDPDMEWFRENMNRAKGVLIVPQLVKGGFIFGGSGGSGVLLARGENNIWSNPAFYTMGTGTFGLQAGLEIAEIILMIMTDKGVDKLLTSSFKLGGDIGIAAGPIGAGAKAQVVDILAFSRAKGIYGGLNVEGAVIKVREDLNQVYYGNEKSSPRSILIEHSFINSHADDLRAAVAKLTAQSIPSTE